MTPTQSWAFLIDSVEFTPAVIAGETSLGGSESACLGLARALRVRGHDVHIFTTKLSADAPSKDAAGVHWHPMVDFGPMNAFIEWDVAVCLRWWAPFAENVRARWRILWNQDLLIPGSSQASVMSCAWAYDEVAYVSQYHRQQWEELQPELRPIGWATRNGMDLSLVPTDVPRDPKRIIHVSRPERGLGPLLTMWPALRARVPDATLAICRYSSMYDAQGWGKICASYDEQVQAVNAQVGGIVYLGELNKRQLYEAISSAAVMWYPGVASFAETNCIAATEALACGTPFVGSLKGALPETARPSFDAGLLIPGDAEHDAAYHAASVDAVVRLLEGCASSSVAYRTLQAQGRTHVAGCGYETLAAEWEAHVEDGFRLRYLGNARGVLAQLLHEDDHVAAKIVASELQDTATVEFCDFTIDGKAQGPDDYSRLALKDVLAESETPRFVTVRERFAACRHVLDVGCGNGSFLIGALRAYPDLRATGLDFSPGNIEAARQAATEAGVVDRVTFHQVTVYDFDRHQLHAEWEAFAAATPDRYDGLFVGEFIEHAANHKAVIDGLEVVLEEGATVVYTCPAGAFGELAPRGMPILRAHVHRFAWDDIRTVWGWKESCTMDYLDAGLTARGNAIGHWLIRYVKREGRPAGDRDLSTRIRRTRPMPRLTVGLIARNAELDLAHCLASVWPIADEILIGDTGSEDGTAALAETFGARVLTLDPVEQQPDGFSGARNAVLKEATGDWFLWIDADERMLGTLALRKYLEGHVFHGYVIRQNHLQLDAPNHADVPVRLFRRSMPIQFYGCVHEQPQMGDCNGDITPCLDAADVQIVHTGYLTESVRREKMVLRNRPLIVRDQQRFPDRRLGKVILLRETVLRASHLAAEAGGITQKAHEGYVFGIKLFRTFFADPANQFHKLARPWYESALKALGIGWEVELGLAGRKGGLGAAHAKPERIWVADGAELERLLVHRTRDTSAKMQPVPIHTDPFPVEEAVGV